MPSAPLLKQQSATGVFQQLADAIIARAILGDPVVPRNFFSHQQSSTPSEVIKALRDTALTAQSEHVSASLVETSDPEKLSVAPNRAQFFLDFFESPDSVGYCHPVVTAAAQAPAPAAVPEPAPALAPEPAPAAVPASAPAPALAPEPTRQADERHSSQAPHLPGQRIRFGPYEIRPTCGYELPFGRDYQPIPYNSISRLAGYVGLDDYSLYIREVPDAPEYGLRPSRNGIWVRQPEEKEYRRLEPGQAERISPETYIRVGGTGLDADSGLPVVVLD